MNVQEIITRESIEKGYTIGDDGVVKNPKGDIIKGSDERGYLKTSYVYGGKRYKLYFHKLQAFIKYGEDMFKKGVLVRHINGVKNDNTTDNIILGGRKDVHKNRTKKTRSKQAGSKSKMTPEVIENILKDHNNGMGYDKLSKKYNIPKSTIADNIKKYKNK